MRRRERGEEEGKESREREKEGVWSKVGGEIWRREKKRPKRGEEGFGEGEGEGEKGKGRRGRTGKEFSLLFGHVVRLARCR